jgi:hypothetical protein
LKHTDRQAAMTQRAYGTMQLRPHGSYPCSLPDIALRATSSFLDPHFVRLLPS